MTNNQKTALEILGYLPAGYVMVTVACNTGFGDFGAIYVDGACVAMFRLAR